jgi:hypothetical protein
VSALLCFSEYSQQRRTCLLPWQHCCRSKACSAPCGHHSGCPAHHAALHQQAGVLCTSSSKAAALYSRSTPKGLTTMQHRELPGNTAADSWKQIHGSLLVLKTASLEHPNYTGTVNNIYLVAAFAAVKKAGTMLRSTLPQHTGTLTPRNTAPTHAKCGCTANPNTNQCRADTLVSLLVVQQIIEPCAIAFYHLRLIRQDNPDSSFLCICSACTHNVKSHITANPNMHLFTPDQRPCHTNLGHLSKQQACRGCMVHVTRPAAACRA